MKAFSLRVSFLVSRFAGTWALDYEGSLLAVCLVWVVFIPILGCNPRWLQHNMRTKELFSSCAGPLGITGSMPWILAYFGHAHKLHLRVLGQLFVTLSSRTSRTYMSSRIIAGWLANRLNAWFLPNQRQHTQPEVCRVYGLPVTGCQV